MHEDVSGQTLVDSMTDGVEPRIEEDMDRLERGALVDRYIVLHELGAGGMGVVYAAFDPELDRKVALKLLNARRGTARARARLLREARAIASVRNPHVVTVYDVGIYDDRVFVVMELVSGLTLRRWLQRQQPGWTDVLAVLRQAGLGLEAAHQCELIHRDFKPDNVLVDEGGRAVVLDFGLARRLGKPEPEPEDHDQDRDRDLPIRRAVDAELTRTGAKVGTPAYMAPEQHGGGWVDARTDQYAFCVVTWEAMFGCKPFVVRGADDDTDVAIPSFPPEPAAPADSPVPHAIREVLRRGMAGASDARYPSMRDLLTALDRAAKTPLPRSSAWSRLSAWSGSSRLSAGSRLSAWSRLSGSSRLSAGSGLSGWSRLSAWSRSSVGSRSRGWAVGGLAVALFGALSLGLRDTPSPIFEGELAELPLTTSATRVLVAQGDGIEAEQHLLREALLAHAAGQDERAAEAWVQLVWVRGIAMNDPVRAGLWAAFAEAASMASGRADLRQQLDGLREALATSAQAADVHSPNRSAH